MFPEEYTEFKYIDDCEEKDVFEEIDRLSDILDKIYDSDWEILV